MAALALALGVAQSSCHDCARPRLIADELVTVEISCSIEVRRRVTVLEGCAECVGSSAIL